MQAVALGAVEGLRVDVELTAIIRLITPLHAQGLGLFDVAQHDAPALANKPKHLAVAVLQASTEWQRLATGVVQGQHQAGNVAGGEALFDDGAASRYDLRGAVVDLDFGAQLVGL